MPAFLKWDGALVDLDALIGEAESGFTLQHVDGEADYFDQFTNGLPTTASFFPIAVWGSYEFSDTTYGDGDTGLEHVQTDKAAGINLYVYIDDVSEEAYDNILAEGMLVFHAVGFDDTYVNSTVRGYVAIDEPDMSMLSGSDDWDGEVGWGHCIPEQDLGGRCGYTATEDRILECPAGEAVYVNWGKGVINGENCSDADAETFVSLPGIDVTNGDWYAFTDPWPFDNDGDVDLTAPDHFPVGEAGNVLTVPKLRRAYNYGLTVDRIRELDGRDGDTPAERIPVWVTVELGNPWDDGQGSSHPTAHRQIDPDELRAAVWHGLIAGARGVLYFNHNFSETPTVTHHIIRDTTNFGAIVSAATALNDQITDLASVLNAPTVTDRFVDGANVRSMVKYLDGDLYVFSASTKDGGSSSYSATFSITDLGDVADVPVIGESRTVDIVDDEWTDTFADDLAVHIYGPIPAA